MTASLPRLLLIAIAYALCGWAALQIVIPPDYVSVLFPSAGIALVAVLLFGIRGGVAVFAGAALVQMIASVQAGGAFLNWNIIPPAFGASLQAAAGVALMRRLIGQETLLDTPRDIILFVGVVAPLGCIVNASIGSVTLLQAGVIGPEHFWFTLANWWLGDTLGVLLATPLLLSFVAQPKDIWRPRRLPLAVTLLATTLLTALVFNEIRHTETARTEQQYAREAGSTAHNIERRITAQLDLLFALERFTALSVGFSRDDFRDFTSNLLKRYDGTQNYTWNPRVAGDERHNFEASIRFAYHKNFEIIDRVHTNPPGLTQAVAADVYLPILYVEPFAGNESVLGLNVLSIPPARRAIELTLLTGLAHASAPFRLVQETGEQVGVVVYQAVFQKHNDQSRFVGLVTTALRIDDLVSSALKGTNTQNTIDYCLVDRSDGQPQRLSGPINCETDNWLATPLTSRHQIDFASRQWELVLQANQVFSTIQGDRTEWAVVVIGLLTTSVLVAFLLMTTGHQRRIARIVDLRTAELAETSRNLALQKEALNQAQEIAHMGSFELVPGSRTVNYSEGLRILLTLPAGDSVPLTTLLQAIALEDRDKLLTAIRDVSAHPDSRALDCRSRSPSQKILYFVIESEWRLGVVTRIRATAQDVTEARLNERAIQRLAHYDPLTGLSNRSHWMTRAAAAMDNARRHGESLAVLFLDLDQFKTINDSLGHAVGDQLLCRVASLLESELRDEDVLGRLGGDEFVVLLPRIDHPGDAATVARKLLSVLARPQTLDQHELRLSVSIGIAVFPGDANDLQTLIKHADTAMYGAKSAGRDNFQFFIPEMNQRAIERLKLESGIRRAIDTNEFRLHYQPQFDATSNTLIGVEALLRWSHPELGSVTPDQFIPVAEDTGLIAPLGEWVLREACTQQRKWQDSRLGHIQVAINISPLQFRRPDFFDQVSRIISETGAIAENIELEITESALTQGTEELVRRLKALVNTGVTLALDDFGTGYSCLSILKKLPLGRLKLDRAFVQDLPGDAEDAAITRAALSMARDLGMEVVAEGVETAEQRDYLLEHGCSIMQGYFYDKPMTTEDFEAKYEASAQTPELPAPDRQS